MQCMAMKWITVGRKSFDGKRHPYRMRPGKRGEFTGIRDYSSQLVPCGKCAFCLQNKRSSWMFRVFHEMRTQEHKGYFLTLTYDEKHVQRADNGLLSLRFYDVQLYLKRLRKAKYYAKYICVGEYGTETHRPHYHMLLWTNAPVEFLESNWKSSRDGSRMGSIYFGSLTMASAMYTLKYIIQPKQLAVAGLEKTRAQFSKGIGIGYLDEDVYNWHTWNYDDPIFMSFVGSQKVALPRYYRNKIFTKHQGRVNGLKVKEEVEKDFKKKVEDLIAKGVKNPELKIAEQRIVLAQQILKQTKYSLSL